MTHTRLPESTWRNIWTGKRISTAELVRREQAEINLSETIELRADFWDRIKETLK